MFIKSEHPADDLRKALTLAESAVGIDPEHNVGYAALALAQSLIPETYKALINVRRALTIQSHGANTNAIASVALIISGMPDKAIELLSEALRINPNAPRTPYLNILSVAQYVTKDYTGAAESIKKNRTRKGPTGPHMDVLLAATYVQMGKNFEAQAVIEKLQRTNPDYPVESWLGNFIKSKDELRATMSKLEAMGLSES
jgi:tetratricopeptide (TPR) repeat protein